MSNSTTEVKEQLKKLERETRDLWHMIKCREKSVDAVEGTVSSTEDSVKDLMKLIGAMEQEINECTNKLSELETKRESLLAERETLQEVLMKRKEPAKETATESKDIDTERIELERAKRDDVRDMLLQKRDELDLAVDRKRHVENEIVKEWDKIRSELRKMHEARREVFDELDAEDNQKLENLKIARDLTDDEGKERLNDAIEYLTLLKEERELTEELNQLELDCEYQVNETNQALAIKKKQMKRLEEISREYHEMLVRDGIDTGFYVRETSPCRDLSTENKDVLMLVESTSDLDMEEIGEDANTLHHCDRRTDLHIDVEGDEELKSFAQQLEQNMNEYMEKLKIEEESPSADSPHDVEGTVYPDTEDNLHDAALELEDLASQETMEEELQKLPPTPTPTPIAIRPFSLHHMESSSMDPTFSLKARMRKGLGLHDKSRGGSQTSIKSSGIKATGSGTFKKGWKK